MFLRPRDHSSPSDVFQIDHLEHENKNHSDALSVRTGELSSHVASARQSLSEAQAGLESWRQRAELAEARNLEFEARYVP